MQKGGLRLREGGHKGMGIKNLNLDLLQIDADAVREATTALDFVHGISRSGGWCPGALPCKGEIVGGQRLAIAPADIVS